MRIEAKLLPKMPFKVSYKGIVYDRGFPDDIIAEIAAQFSAKVELAREGLTKEEKELDDWLVDSKQRAAKLNEGVSIEYWLQSWHDSLCFSLEMVGYKLEIYRARSDDDFGFWKAFSQYFLSKLEFVKSEAEKLEVTLRASSVPDPRIGKIDCDHPTWTIWGKEADLDYVPRARAWMNPKWQEAIYWCVDCPIRDHTIECGDKERLVPSGKILLSSDRKHHSRTYAHTHFNHIFPARLSLVPHFRIYCPQKCGLRFVPARHAKRVGLSHCPRCKAEMVCPATYRDPNVYGDRVCHDCATSFDLDRYSWSSQGFFCQQCLERRENREKQQRRRRKRTP